MRVTLFCGILFVLATVLNANRFRCDYTYFDNAEGYLKFHVIPANWHEARLRCHLEGSMLASPLNTGISLAMKILMERGRGITCAVFTGVNAFFSRGDFYSIEGVPLSKIPHKWAQYEPDNYNDQEQYIMMLPSGELADVNGTEPLPYFCYKKTKKSLITNSCGTIDPEEARAYLTFSYFESIGYEVDMRTGSCYKFHKVIRTWSRAFMTCAAEGAYLAIINSETESQIIKEIFSKHPADTMPGVKDFAFAGFHDWGEHGEFLTVKGQTLTEAGFAKFLPGQPDNATTGEFCGSVHRQGLLNDIWCEHKVAFICEKDQDSLLCEEAVQ